MSIRHGRALAPLFLTVALGVAACDVPPGEEGDVDVEGRTTAVINGTPVDPNNSGFVFLGGRCSGTLLNNSWILTAGHCNLLVGEQAVMGTQSRPLAQIANYPGVDLALVRLQSPISMAGSLTGYTKAMYPWSVQDLVEQTLTCTGYGYDTWNQTGLGTLRKGAVRVTSARGGESPYIYYVPGPNGTLPAPGDSGSSCQFATALGDVIANMDAYGAQAGASGIQTSWFSRWALDTMYPNQTFYCHGTECRTTAAQLPDSFTTSRSWKPCGGGAWQYEIQYSLEPGYDFLTVDGKQVTDVGTLAGSKAAGSSLSLALSTDSSVTSRGIEWLRARCIAAPAAVGGRFTARLDNRPVLVARTAVNGALLYRARTSVGGTGAAKWAAWKNLGGTMASQPVAVPNLDGRLLLLARSSDNKLWYRQESALNSDSFGGWTVIPHVDAAGAAVRAFINDPALVRNSDGRLSAFSIANDGTLWQATQKTAGGAWAAWRPLDKPPTTKLTWTPVAALNANRSLLLFARGGDGAVWLLPQIEAGDTWNAWQPLGGATIQNGEAIAAALEADGRMTVIMNNGAATLSQRTQTRPNGTDWSDWANLPGGAHGQSRPALVPNADGRLMAVFWANYGSELDFQSETAPNAPTWSNWASLTTPVTSSPVALRDAAGLIHVIALGSGGTVYETLQTAANATTWTVWSSGNLGGPASGL